MTSILIPLNPHPDRSNGQFHRPLRREETPAFRFCCCSFSLPGAPARAQQPAGQSIYALTQQFLAVAPKRFNGSPGHLAAETFIKEHFKPEAAKGNFETDQFTANTPAGPQTMRNFIVRFPGKKDGVIVLASHYETNYPLRDIAFVGANDGACTTALLIAVGHTSARTHRRATPSGCSSTTAKRPSAPGPTPTRSTARATSPRAGSPTAPPAASRPCWWQT